MKIELTNYLLVPAVEFLSGMELKASESRHRSKLCKKLTEAITSLQESQKELQELYGERDKEGNLIYLEDGLNVVVQVGKQADFKKELDILANEVAVIESGIYAKNFEKMATVLENYEGTLSGQDAALYDILLDKFEEQQ